MKKFFTKRNIYITLFAILYAVVALVSLIHSFSFFGLANNSAMSIMLGTAFEIGQAAVLFAILTSSKDRSRIMPWVLMVMFTLVQIIGNVFSSYKYLMQNNVGDLQYFKEPIFIWMDLPDAQATVIITYIVGAILPLCSLFLTSMIANYLEDNKNEKEEDKEVSEDIAEPNVDDEKPKDEYTELEESSDSEIDNVDEVEKKSHFINI